MKYSAKENPYQEHILQNMPRVLVFVSGVLGVPIGDEFIRPQVLFSKQVRRQSFGRYHVDNVLREIERVRQLASMHGRVSSAYAVGKMGAFLRSLEHFLKVAGNFDEWSRLSAMAVEMEGIALQEPLVGRVCGIYRKCQQLLLDKPVQAVFTSDNRIIFYEEGIKKICAEMNIRMEDYLLLILVHELAHALHFNYVMDEHRAAAVAATPMQYGDALGYWAGEGCKLAQVRTVKEALARYVQYCWACNNLPAAKSAMELEHAGAGVIYPNWPYAGASMLLEMDADEAGDKVRSLLRLSAVSWASAYNLLCK